MDSIHIHRTEQEHGLYTNLVPRVSLLPVPENEVARTLGLSGGIFSHANIFLIYSPQEPELQARSSLVRRKYYLRSILVNANQVTKPCKFGFSEESYS